MKFFTVEKLMAVDPLTYESSRPSIAPPELSVLPGRKLTADIAVGGLGTSDAERWLYNPILQHDNAVLPAKEAFFAPVDRGRAPIDEMTGDLEERIDRAATQAGRPVNAFFHSLGAHLGSVVVLNRPELFESVTSAGGVPIGVESLTKVGHVVKLIMHNAKGKDGIMRGSDYMQAHIERVRSEWSPNIPVLLIATFYDELAGFGDTLGMELPDGQQPEKYAIVPPIPFIGSALRKARGMPADTKLVTPLRPALHEFLPRHSEVIRLHREHSGVASAQLVPDVRPTAQPRLVSVT